MKKIILFLIVAVFLISGCAKEAVVEEEEDEVKFPTVSEQDIDEEEEELNIVDVEAVKKAVASELSEDVKELLKKADSVNSLEYSYQNSIEDGKAYYSHVYIVGDKMKQEVNFKKSSYAAGTKYDTIYVNLKEKTIEGYCEDEDCDDRNALIPVEYSDFIMETPFDVIDNLKGNKIGTEVYEGRESIVVEYEEDDMRTKTLVWEYKGLPLKYIEYKNNKKYRTVIFDHLIYNQVSDEQVAHQQLG